MSDNLSAALDRIKAQIKSSERDLARQLDLLAQIAADPSKAQRAAEAFKRARARLEKEQGR